MNTEQALSEEDNWTAASSEDDSEPAESSRANMEEPSIVHGFSRAHLLDVLEELRTRARQNVVEVRQLFKGVSERDDRKSAVVCCTTSCFVCFSHYICSLFKLFHKMRSLVTSKQFLELQT